MTDQIATIRADLAAWSAGKPKAVQNAVANLDGWLSVMEIGPHPDDPVDALACTARAVETLRGSLRDSVLSAYGRSDG